MSFPIEHPIWFLGLCGVLIANGYRVWKTHHVFDQLAQVIPLRPITHLHAEEIL